MVDKEKVTKLIDEEIRPALQSHGGDIQLVEITDEGVVKVRLEGACKGCPMAQVTIQRGVQAKLQEAIPEITEVVAVEPEGAEEPEQVPES